jgi:hypothetical protein
VITNWQQSLLRLGANYQTHPKLQLRAGYAWIETFPYGETPLNRFGRDFTEHRLFQMATLTDKLGIADLSHRFMLEQRWLGTYSAATLDSEDRFLFLNRMRYMFRIQFPLFAETVGDGTWYAALYDEVFIGFGRNVGENIFDQNRIGVLLGYAFTKSYRIEAGYLNQIVKLGREVSGSNVFQYNHGIILNLVMTVDFSSTDAK